MIQIETRFQEIDVNGCSRMVTGICRVEEGRFPDDMLRSGRFLQFDGQTSQRLLYVVMVEPGDGETSKYITAMMSEPIASDRNNVYATIPAENIKACHIYLEGVGFTLTEQ
jgi:hypothetical protein